MKIGVIGAGAVGSACLLSSILRGIAREIVVVNREREREGHSQFGIGMVSARIAEIVLRDERGVIPIGSYNPKYGVTLSMPSVLGQTGVVQILEPAMSQEEREALQRSADTLKAAVARIQGG